MSNFKVGDKVRRVNKRHVAVQIGDILTVKNVDIWCNISFEELPEWGHFDYYNFELVEEKNMNEFNIDDLKTGMRVTLSNGKTGFVFTDCVHSGDGAHLNQPFIKYEGSGRGWDYITDIENIIKVETVSSPYYILFDAIPTKYATIWEKKTETPEQKELRELKVQSEELLKKQQELNEKIAKLESK